MSILHQETKRIDIQQNFSNENFLLTKFLVHKFVWGTIQFLFKQNLIQKYFGSKRIFGQKRSKNFGSKSFLVKKNNFGSKKILDPKEFSQHLPDSFHKISIHPPGTFQTPSRQLPTRHIGPFLQVEVMCRLLLLLLWKGENKVNFYIKLSQVCKFGVEFDKFRP